MRKTTLAASALLATLALGACGGGDGGGLFGSDAAASGEAGNFGELEDFGDGGALGGSADSSGADEEFQRNFENLDQFIADGLGLDEPLSEGGVADEDAEPAAAVLDGGLLATDTLAGVLDAVESEHGGPIAPLLVRITAGQVTVAVDEDQSGYRFEDGVVTATDAGDLGTFGPEPLTDRDFDVDLESLVLYASDAAGFDPSDTVEVTIGRSRIDSDLAFARILVEGLTEGYVDVSLEGEVLSDNVL